MYSENEHEQLLCELQSLLDDNSSPEGLGVEIPKERVRNAIVLAEYWPRETTIPYLDVDEDGEIQLYVFEDNGLVSSALEFAGDQHLCSYSIETMDQKHFGGTFNVNSQKDRETVISLLKRQGFSTNRKFVN